MTVYVDDAMIAVDGTLNTHPGAVLAPGAVAMCLWLVGCTAIWVAALAMHDRNLFKRRTTLGLGILLQLAVAVALVGVTAGMVLRHQTIFGIDATRWPAALVELVRRGQPTLDAPSVISGRSFGGPFLSKSRGQWQVIEGLVVEIPEWRVGGVPAPVSLQFNRQRRIQLLTCPELSEITRCRAIAPAWNVKLDAVILKRGVYFGDRGAYEFSEAIPDVSFWREDAANPAARCWLHLEDWPMKGDAARAQAECSGRWPEQAARLRGLLERRFPLAENR